MTIPCKSSLGAALAIVLAMAGCSRPSAPEKTAAAAPAHAPAAPAGVPANRKLVIKGSDTLGAKLVPQLCRLYENEHPGFSYEIAAEGSSTGIAAVIDGTAQIGMSSRAAKSKEEAAAQAKGVTLTSTVVAYDGMAVIVNSANPLDELSLEQVARIFTGAVTDWSGVDGRPGQISVYTRNTSSGTYSAFQEMAMGGRDYAASSQKMGGNEQIAAEVAANPNGIGYVGLAYLANSGVKAVTINGVSPSVATVADHSYPLARPTYYYTNGEPTGLAREFVGFSLGTEGQKVVGEVGFIPVEREHAAKQRAATAMNGVAP